MSTILVINSGSSSIKYQLIDIDAEAVIAKGLIERIGTDHGVLNHEFGDVDKTYDIAVLDHIAGFEAMIDACAKFGPDLDTAGIVAVGHRVVQGGARFIAPTIINASVIRTLKELSPLAPLHNPPNILGIQAAQHSFPDIPHVAVFDTAFHQTMPPEAYTYAIDRALAEQHRIRRYGFHGTSHKYVSELAAKHLGKPLEDVNTIVLHIGNGVSACAVRGGKSVETSMGLTPLEGLVMGTRSGDIDPGIVFHLARQSQMTPEQIDDLLNRRSGLLGMTGTSDMRDVQKGADRGDEQNQLALDVYCHRIKHYVGAYFAQLGRLDAIAFTAGVGENSAVVRAKSLSKLEHLGIEIDPDRNEDRGDSVRTISTDASKVSVLVVPTNEELEIARQTYAAISSR